MRPFRQSSPKRLLRVCEVVRQRLGLDSLCCEFEMPDRPCEGDPDVLAHTWIFYSGWRCRMVFYPLFFEKPLQHQLETVVHEHLHLLMHPLEQIVLRCEREWCKPKFRDEFMAATEVARELTVEHATAPMLRLLQPHINKVL